MALTVHRWCIRAQQVVQKAGHCKGIEPQPFGRSSRRQSRVVKGYPCPKAEKSQKWQEIQRENTPAIRDSDVEWHLAMGAEWAKGVVLSHWVSWREKGVNSPGSWPSYSLVAKLWLSQTLSGGLAQCSPLNSTLYLAFTP